MGCDMYCVVEALNKKSAKWDCFGVSRANRCYMMFSKIADVRNSEKENEYIEPIVEPRGWPADASDSAETWYNDNELCFSHTWLNRKELEALDEWLQKNEICPLWEMLGFEHLQFLFCMEGGWKKAAFTRYSDLRVVFFFTN